MNQARVIVAILLVASGCGARARAPETPTFDALPVPVMTGKPTAVNLNSHSGARKFRTALRLGASEGPNFAGHFTIVTWGCGTDCVQHALVDAKTDTVFFPPEIATIFTFWGGPESPGVQETQFRVDSALLILAGSTPTHSDLGLTYLRWTGTRFVEVEHVAKPQWQEAEYHVVDESTFVEGRGVFVHYGAEKPSIAASSYCAVVESPEGAPLATPAISEGETNAHLRHSASLRFPRLQDAFPVGTRLYLWAMLTKNGDCRFLEETVK
jgi:hypothetical protein